MIDQWEFPCVCVDMYIYWWCHVLSVAWIENLSVVKWYWCDGTDACVVGTHSRVLHPKISSVPSINFGVHYFLPFFFHVNACENTIYSLEVQTIRSSKYGCCVCILYIFYTWLKRPKFSFAWLWHWVQKIPGRHKKKKRKKRGLK